jgi:hypothetical protein
MNRLLHLTIVLLAVPSFSATAQEADKRLHSDVQGKPTELDPAINPVIVAHNRMAAKVMKELNVPVNDFYSLLVGKLDLARGDQFHWKPDACKILAQTAIDSILRELKSR